MTTSGCEGAIDTTNKERLENMKKPRRSCVFVSYMDCFSKSLSPLANNTRVDDPTMPVHLVIWATQTAVTTATCIYEYESRSQVSIQQRTQLGYLYKPYLALAVLMLGDMFLRIRRQVLEGAKVKEIMSRSRKEE